MAIQAKSNVSYALVAALIMPSALVKPFSRSFKCWNQVSIMFIVWYVQWSP